MSILAKIRSSLAAFKRDDKGAAFAEFAIVMTVLAVLLPGSWEATNALLVKQKVSQTATVLADLTSQAPSINLTAYNSMSALTRKIMHPYEGFNTRLRVIGVQVDSRGRVRTKWSYGTAPLSASSLPSSLIIKNSFYVMSATEVDYEPIFGERYIGTIKMRKTAILSPRLSASVEKK